MPQPCVTTSTSVTLTANGSPAVLQADVRLAASVSQRLLLANDGLYVRDANFRVERGTNSGTLPTGGAPSLIPYDLLKYATPALMSAASGLSLAGLPAGFTVPNGMGGIWRIAYGFATDSAATIGTRSYLQLRINNVEQHDLIHVVVSGDSQIIMGGSGDWALSPGDLVNTYYVNNDSAVRILIANPNNFLSMSYVGPGV